MQQVDAMELMTSREAADYLKVGVGTLHRWARDKSDTFPAVRMGKAYRIRRSDLLLWFEQKRRETEAAQAQAGAVSRD